MLVQELDLHIHYRPGHKHQNADALSQISLPFLAVMTATAHNSTVLLATLQVDGQPTKGREDSLD